MISRLDGEIAGPVRAHEIQEQDLIKGDLGFKSRTGNTTYRLYGLEGDDRDRLLDTIREGFHALGIGEQSNFLTAMGDAEEAEAPAPKKRGRPLKPKPRSLARR